MSPDEEFFRLMADAIRALREFEQQAQRVAQANEVAFRQPGGTDELA